MKGLIKVHFYVATGNRKLRYVLSLLVSWDLCSQIIAGLLVHCGTRLEVDCGSMSSVYRLVLVAGMLDP